LRIAVLGGQGRAQGAEQLLARHGPGVAAGLGAVDGAAVAPQRGADGADAGAAGALLLPELAAGAGDLGAALGLVGAAALGGAPMAHRLPEQLLIDGGGEDLVEQLEAADGVVVEVLDGDRRHGWVLGFAAALGGLERVGVGDAGEAAAGAGRLLGAADEEVAAVGAGDGAADGEQVLVGIHRDDLEVAHGDLGIAHVAGGAHALEHARGEGAGADGAGGAVEHGAVGGGAAAEVVALDEAGEAAAFADAFDVEEVALLEHFGQHLVADLGAVAFGVLGERDLAQQAAGREVGGLEALALGLGEAAGLGELDEAELGGVVAVAGLGLALHHHAGAGLDERDRDALAGGGVGLAHADFLAEDAVHHGGLLVLLAEGFDFDVHAGGEVELHERVHGLRGGFEQIEEALVGAHLELLAALLVHVRGAEHGEAVDGGGQGDGAGDFGAGAAGGIDDLLGGGVEDARVVGFQADADSLSDHGSLPYCTISVMVPAPTVRPPSRMAKRRPFSIATGVMSSTVRATLSPGITISVPAGSSATPVTSVVRM